MGPSRVSRKGLLLPPANRSGCTRLTKRTSMTGEHSRAFQQMAPTCWRVLSSCAVASNCNAAGPTEP
ncbi:unnamed protein product, partial [Ixodes pacificus]